MHENFYHTVKVYYEDTDAGGIVYYANYLKYLERARTEALATIGLSNLQIKEKFGALIIVKSCNIEYKKKAKLEDKLKIYSSILSIKKASFFMLQNIKKDNESVLDFNFDDYGKAFLNFVSLSSNNLPYQNLSVTSAGNSSVCPEIPRTSLYRQNT